MLETLEHSKERDFCSDALWKIKEVMVIVNLEHYYRAIWDGRGRENVWEGPAEGEGKERRGKQDVLVMWLKSTESTIPGSCNYKKHWWNTIFHLVETFKKW